MIITSSMEQAIYNFFGALGILFIALKLMGFINWEWVWVLAPIWMSLVAYAVAVSTAVHKKMQEIEMQNLFDDYDDEMPDHDDDDGDDEDDQK